MNILLLPEDTGSHCHITDKATYQHITQVLKAQIGDTVKIGIKNANLGTATIDTISDTTIQLTDITTPTPPPPKLPLTVILALPRPKVLRRLIMDMTAMGVKQLHLVNSYRSEKSYWQSPFLGQIDNYIHEGLQQACDTAPLTVQLHKRLKPFVEDTFSQMVIGKNAIIAHPYADTPFHQVFCPQDETLLVIGAEGGFIPYEVDLFVKHGCTPAHIGRRILRTENAVSVLCGAFLIGF